MCVEFDLLDHVPTRSLKSVDCAATRDSERSSAEATEDSMVAGAERAWAVGRATAGVDSEGQRAAAGREGVEGAEAGGSRLNSRSNLARR